MNNRIYNILFCFAVLIILFLNILFTLKDYISIFSSFGDSSILNIIWILLIILDLLISCYIIYSIVKEKHFQVDKFDILTMILYFVILGVTTIYYFVLNSYSPVSMLSLSYCYKTIMFNDILFKFYSLIVYKKQ